MKTTTMCILSGLFGAMFAVACGAVSGVGDKVANADNGVGFSKEVYEYSISPSGVPSESPPRSAFEDNPVWSWHFICDDGSKSNACDVYSKMVYVFIY